MRAVVMVLHAQLRQHWKSWLALAALTALAGGFVMTTVTTARRTAAAFPGFVARYGYDAVVYTGHPLPELARIPQVARVTTAPAPFTATPLCASCRKRIDPGSFAIFEVPPDSLSRTVKLLSGRMPDQSSPSEVLASYTLARDNGARIGSVIKVPILTRAQVNSGPGSGKIAASQWHALRIVGLVVAENEFPAGNGARYDLFPTKAFAAAANPGAAILPRRVASPLLPA